MEQDPSERTLLKREELPFRDEKGRFLRSGNPLGKPKGAITKFARLRGDFLKAYRQMGGVQGLLTWAKEHPSEFYMMIFKLLPKDREIPFLDQARVLTYEERLKLVMHGSLNGEEPGTALDDVNNFGPSEEEEGGDDEGL
jgi:hypothetical protein